MTDEIQQSTQKKTTFQNVDKEVDEGNKAYPNLTGRPKGSKNKHLNVRKKPREAVRSMLEAKSPRIMEKVIALGLDGDVQCLKMLMDRILPAHKSVELNTTKTDYSININVESLEAITDVSASPIDITPSMEEIEVMADKVSDSERSDAEEVVDGQDKQ